MDNITAPISWLDLQWYALDHNKRICLFKSNGGGIPCQLEGIDMDPVYDFFENLTEMADNELIVNPELEWIAKLKTVDEKNNYLKNFLFFAKRGLVCYDRTYTSRPIDPRYHLVVKPSKVLDLHNIPNSILNKIIQNPQGFNIINNESIDISKIVWNM
ncbi:hypothetical protein ACE38W_10040 [Chitinophaga sp. Hz27]|uniref:hypothetical protein n=1 Tax=Chitinophaga sp. Hz27 TaxID=3347169 RepID=UPI0035DA00DD